MRKQKGMPGWIAFLIGLASCALPFAVLPALLYRAPEAMMEPGLWLLLWALYPLLALLVPAWAARRGVPALLACILPTLGYLLVLVHQLAPVLGVLLGGQALAVVSASYGQERRKRARETRQD